MASMLKPASIAFEYADAVPPPTENGGGEHMHSDKVTGVIKFPCSDDPEEAHKLNAWYQDILAIIERKSFPGFESITMTKEPNNHFALLHFSSEECLNKWAQSDERRELLERWDLAKDELPEVDVRRATSVVEFASTEPTCGPRPKWKLVLLSFACGLPTSLLHAKLGTFGLLMAMTGDNQLSNLGVLVLTVPWLVCGPAALLTKARFGPIDVPRWLESTVRPRWCLWTPLLPLVRTLEEGFRIFVPGRDHDHEKQLKMLQERVNGMRQEIERHSVEHAKIAAAVLEERSNGIRQDIELGVKDYTQLLLEKGALTDGLKPAMKRTQQPQHRPRNDGPRQLGETSAKSVQSLCEPLLVSEDLEAGHASLHHADSSLSSVGPPSASPSGLEHLDKISLAFLYTVNWHFRDRFVTFMNEDFRQVLEDTPGYVTSSFSITTDEPEPLDDSKFKVLYKFWSVSALDAWESSDKRAKMLMNIAPFLKKRVELKKGYDSAWLLKSESDIHDLYTAQWTTKGRRTPPIWKSILLTIVAKWCVVILLQNYLAPKLAACGLRIALRTLIMTLVGTMLVVYITVPFLKMAFDHWLNDSALRAPADAPQLLKVLDGGLTTRQQQMVLTLPYVLLLWPLAVLNSKVNLGIFGA